MRTRRDIGERRKPYSAPTLVRYGDFRKLTATGKGGTTADGLGPSTKFNAGQ